MGALPAGIASALGPLMANLIVQALAAGKSREYIANTITGLGPDFVNAANGTGLLGNDIASQATTAQTIAAIGEATRGVSRNEAEHVARIVEEAKALGLNAAQVSAGLGLTAQEGLSFLSKYGIPAFAAGGMHRGGLRIVGERGPELEYTGPSRLHQCYSFEMMGPDYAPAAFRRKIEDFFAGAPNGWPMWAFSNHDVPRHVTRWSRHGTSQDALAKQAAALILSFEGSICLWQGEELGQTDTDLAFHELTDPQGIAFWPEPVGRDNTRTPMVWDGTAHGGFTTGTPWLPVKPPQLARNVAAQAQDPDSVMNFYRLMLRYRRASVGLRTGRTRFLDLPDPVLGFTRGEGLACLFNLSPAETTIRIKGLAEINGPSLAAHLDGDSLTLGPNGVAFASTKGPVEAP
jgi:hypothetical protein